ncbi:ParB/Srx family N-terminal domain-containing protein [Pendulispora brunnea]|uniref:ParB/Srx family N-terminal domain-containing protein n=1 Tax=Pendulispora brunnea TaxID=2905690 RepID=A0ABZ2K806_9BACT
MKGDELRELADDIRKNGLRAPIVVLDNAGERWVLDGRNRLRACQMAEVEPEHIVWQGTDPVAYVTSANLRRRQLRDSQLAILAVAIEKLYSDDAGKPEKAGNGADNAGSTGKKETPQADRAEGMETEARRPRAKAAAQVGVSTSLVQRAKKVVDQAAPEVTAAVQAGKLTITDAVRIVDRPQEEQAELVARVEAGEAKTLSQALAKSTQPAVASPDAAVDSVWKRVMKLSRGELAELHRRLGDFLENATEK